MVDLSDSASNQEKTWFLLDYTPKEMRVIFSQSGTFIKQVEIEKPSKFSILVELTCYNFDLPLQ